MHLGNVTEKHPGKNGPPNWEDLLGGHCISEGKVFQGIIHSGEMEFLTYFMGSEWTTRVSNKSLPLTRFTLLQEKNSNSNNSNCKMPTGDVANIR